MTKGMTAYGELGGGDLVAPPTGDRPLSPQAPFFSRDLVVNLKKKNYTKGLSPYGRATGGYF